MSYCDLTDAEIDQKIDDAYQRGWRACLAEVKTKLAEAHQRVPDFIRRLKADSTGDTMLRPPPNEGQSLGEWLAQVRARKEGKDATQGKE